MEDNKDFVVYNDIIPRAGESKTILRNIRRKVV